METGERRNSNARIGVELEERTLAFAVRIVTLVGSLERSVSGVVIGRQLLRSGTSIGANYREANRAESRDDFVHKVAVSLKEAAETDYWLTLCLRTKLGDASEVDHLCREVNELIAILSSIRGRARKTRSE